MNNTVMNKNEVVERLKYEAAHNPTANAVFHMWALRVRARFIVTIGALSARMRAEGFHYEISDYAKLLRLLSDLGFGTLEISSKGKVKALKDIKVTLQSIGQAACGGPNQLNAYTPRNKFRTLVPRVAPKLELVPAAAPKQLERRQPRQQQPHYSWGALMRDLFVLPIQRFFSKFRHVGLL